MAIELITGMSGSPHISSDDVRAFNRVMFGAGTFIVDGCTASAKNANTIHITAGELLIGGGHFRITGTGEDATIGNGSAGKVRTDAICVLYERDNAGIETCSIGVVRGAEVATGTTPTAPEDQGSYANNDASVRSVLYLVDVVASGVQNIRKADNVSNRPIFNTENPPIPVEFGGTGRVGFTNRNLLMGNDSGGIGQLAPTHGALYVPTDGSFPRYGNLPIASGGTGAGTVAEARVNLGFDDTGWQTLSSGTNWYIRYRRVGNLVEICGESTGGKNIEAGKYTDIVTLPAEIAPAFHAANTRFIIGALGIMGAQTIAAEVLIANTSSGNAKKLQLYSSDALSYWHFNAMYFV